MNLSFFTAKIQKIRESVSATVPGTGGMLSMCSPKTDSNTMTQFDPINVKNLQDIMHHLKSSFCCLDILPGGFLQKSFRLHDSRSATDC